MAQSKDTQKILELLTQLVATHDQHTTVDTIGAASNKGSGLNIMINTNIHASPKQDVDRPTDFPTVFKELDATHI